MSQFNRKDKTFSLLQFFGVEMFVLADLTDENKLTPRVADTILLVFSGLTANLMRSGRPTSCQLTYTPSTPAGPHTHLGGSTSSRRQGNAWTTWAMRRATEAELAAMTRRDIMSKSEPVGKRTDLSKDGRLTQP